MREHYGEIGFAIVLLAILLLTVPGFLGFGGTWSFMGGIWLGIIGVFFMRAERSREERRERREQRDDKASR